MILFVVIVGWMVIFVAQAHFPRTKTRNRMKRMMMSFESFFVVQWVFPPLVLRVVVEPVEQAVLRMNVRIAHMFQVVAHQFACEQQFVLQQVLV